MHFPTQRHIDDLVSLSPRFAAYLARYAQFSPSHLSGLAFQLVVLRGLASLLIGTRRKRAISEGPILLVAPGHSSSVQGEAP